MNTIDRDSKNNENDNNDNKNKKKNKDGVEKYSIDASRRWMILTPGVDLPATTISDICCSEDTIISKKKEYAEIIEDREISRKAKIVQENQIEKEFVNEIENQNGNSEIIFKFHENVEMHCYEECLEIGENETRNIGEQDLLLSVIKQMAILGCNGVLLIADTKDRINDCFDCDTCQKLLVIEKNAKNIHHKNIDTLENINEELQNNAVKRIRFLISEKKLFLSENRDNPGVSLINNLIRDEEDDCENIFTTEQKEIKTIRLESKNENEIEKLDDTDVITFNSKTVKNVPETVQHILKSKITKNPLKVFAIKFWS